VIPNWYNSINDEARDTTWGSGLGRNQFFNPRIFSNALHSKEIHVSSFTVQLIAICDEILGLENFNQIGFVND
jgi:hypothetical protein